MVHSMRGWLSVGRRMYGAIHHNSWARCMGAVGWLQWVHWDHRLHHADRWRRTRPVASAGITTLCLPQHGMFSVLHGGSCTSHLTLQRMEFARKGKWKDNEGKEMKLWEMEFGRKWNLQKIEFARNGILFLANCNAWFPCKFPFLQIHTDEKCGAFLWIFLSLQLQMQMPLLPNSTPTVVRMRVCWLNDKKIQCKIWCHIGLHSFRIHFKAAITDMWKWITRSRLLFKFRHY